MSLISNDFVIEYCKSLGFDLIGFAPAEKLSSEAEQLGEWLRKKFNAGMTYMEKNFDKRLDVNNILHGARTVISLGMNYYKDNAFPLSDDHGKISRYAWGKDYHLVIWEKLDLLAKKLKENNPAIEAVSYIDTGPVMDKAWAVRAGLGWQGKHTNIINREMGSWFFIANVITNYEFAYSPMTEDFCGSCTACLDACPTGALTPYVLDANKCISYLTIENKGDIPSEFRGKFGNWVFGCDICQDVCPWNQKFSVNSSEDDFSAENISIPLREIKDMDETAFRLRFAESPVKRTKLKGLKRNAKFLGPDSD